VLAVEMKHGGKTHMEVTGMGLLHAAAAPAAAGELKVEVESSWWRDEPQ